jgi:hypothetical protein
LLDLELLGVDPDNHTHGLLTIGATKHHPLTNLPITVIHSHDSFLPPSTFTSKRNLPQNKNPWNARVYDISV